MDTQRTKAPEVLIRLRVRCVPFASFALKCSFNWTMVTA